MNSPLLSTDKERLSNHQLGTHSTQLIKGIAGSINIFIWKKDSSDELIWTETQAEYQQLGLLFIREPRVVTVVFQATNAIIIISFNAGADTVHIVHQFSNGIIRNCNR